MKIFAIGDLHLSLQDGQLYKPMSRFGEQWRDHHLRIAGDWRARVAGDDLVLLVGDTSWAMRPAQAAEDLAFIEQLPGRKVLIRGNHDYWMRSRAKVQEQLPPSLRCLWNDSLLIQGVLLVGARLWEMPGLSFTSASGQQLDEIAGLGFDPERDQKLLTRELGRLRQSFEHARRTFAAADVQRTICLTHYPPVDFAGHGSEASRLIAEFGPDCCVFGHLHGLMPGPTSVIVDSVSYRCVACDHVDFRLVQI